jgi:hypothetical protein
VKSAMASSPIDTFPNGSFIIHFLRCVRILASAFAQRTVQALLMSMVCGVKRPKRPAPERIPGLSADFW